MAGHPMQVLAVFFSDRLNELRKCTDVDLHALLEQAAASAEQDACEAGSLTKPPPVDTSTLPAEWLARIHGMADALGQLQLQGPSLEVLSAVVRQDVHDSIAGLGKEWFCIRVLGPVEQYVAAAPLLLLRVLLPSMVRHVVACDCCCKGLPDKDCTVCIHSHGGYRWLQGSCRRPSSRSAYACSSSCMT